MSERIFRCRDMAQRRSVFLFAWNAAKLFTDSFEIVIRPLKVKHGGITAAITALLKAGES